MSKLKVAVIVGSTREQRFSPVSAEWIAKVAAERPEFDVEILDLADYPMGFMATRQPRPHRLKPPISGKPSFASLTPTSSPPLNTTTLRLPF